MDFFPVDVNRDDIGLRTYSDESRAEGNIVHIRTGPDGKVVDWERPDDDMRYRERSGE